MKQKSLDKEEVIREISEFERKYFGHRKRRETLD
jgi:hypothetical protein